MIIHNFEIWSNTHIKSWLYVIIMSRTSFRVNPHSIFCLNVKELLAWRRHHMWSLSDSSVIRTHNHLVRKRTLDHLDHLFFGKFASIQCLSLLDYYFPYYLYCTSVHQRKTNTAQKMKFSIKDFFSKCDLETADLATFTEEIYNEKLHFLCSVHFKDPLKSGPHLKTELWNSIQKYWNLTYGI